MIQVNKTITLDNRVEVNHHVIDYITYSSDIISLGVSSYINKTAYDEGAAPVKITNYIKNISNDTVSSIATDIVNESLDIKNIENILKNGIII